MCTQLEKIVWKQITNKAFKLTSQEIKLPKDKVKSDNLPPKLTQEQMEKISNDITSIKIPEPFQGVTIEMSVASKILRGKMNLDDDVEIKIVWLPITYTGYPKGDFNQKSIKELWI